MIQLKGVSKTFNQGQTYAVKDVSLTVGSGRTLVLLGGSGSGKTTVLKMINRLVEPSSGTIEIDGQDVQDLNLRRLRHSMGYVFQKVGLFPHMTIQENVGINLRLQGQPKEEQESRAQALLKMVDLDPNLYANRLPSELSGGQLQRVGVARAIACDPEYLLMDEPFGALDAITRDALQAKLLELKSSLKKTIVFVTHDISEALRLGDDIAIMNKGYLEQVDSKQTVIKHPRTPYVKNLLDKFHQQLDQLEEDFK